MRQARDLGLPPHRIKQMIRDGRLRSVSYGVVAAAGAPESYDFRSMHAVLVGGHGLTKGIVAALSGPSAAHRSGLLNVAPDKIHVISTRRVRSTNGFVFHGSGRLPAEEVRFIAGIPTTDPARTFLDYCSSEREWRARNLYHRALRDRLLTPDEILARIETESRQGRQGLQLARQIAGQASPGAEKALSGWEETVFEWIAEARLPLPERNVYLPSSSGVDWEVDLLYRDPPTVIEVSPWETHSDPATYAKDIRKREELEAMGFKVIVVTSLSERDSFIWRLRGMLQSATPARIPARQRYR